MSETPNTAKLWSAVDSITQPSSRRIDRDPDPEWIAQLAEDGQGSFCRVEDYRAAMLAYGKIPCLWDQASWAVTTGGEQSGSGGSPLRERSPADLDLMETLLTIRESMGWQLPGRGITPKPKITEQMRQLASYIASHEPQHVEWWTFRFEQWARVLNTHLNAVDAGPKPRRLRNAPCPLCHTRTVTVPDPRDDKQRVVVPALLIDFVNGLIRAATCTACGHAWWKGAQLEELAAALESSDPAGMMSA